ncbi:3R-hydroxymyristoyl ACP dehydrase [Monoraphidium neglectum]|uniref:3R-hydroxymyristoyl ACP dehydrase n=1 Tax=Monoraphidium neglectum TaxID=145388 RepID=A0A0D2NJV0_9CHLO|nr:3R-hydroxymyristoyl ACP dehydrase [Monoraphidium neglectum]KIZ05111.1 3R-hydroxymyristoyl ACP dehydrase [Monoraphidium neglectum]|eukprot:XP_013904130.1 3R-hydroxymyristoyl ACP dehydrase [Monoraphidium neglectum]
MAAITRQAAQPCCSKPSGARAVAVRPSRLAVRCRAEAVAQASPAEAPEKGTSVEKLLPSLKAALDIEEIKKILPHRQAARIVARGVGREHDAAGAAVHHFICATPWPLMFNWYPFLLVDRVVEVVPQKYAIGYKNITVNDQFFNGHFPERAIMPGVLQIEAMAQLGGIAMLDPSDEAARNQFFFGGIEGCRFRRPVVPGDTLVMKVEVTKFNKRFGIVKMDAKGYVGTELAVEAELTLAMGKAS